MQSVFIPTKDYRELPKDAAFEMGKTDAQEDYKAGTCRILFYGMRAAPTESEKRLEKLGVKYDSIAGCIVSEGIRGYADGYNTTMLPLLKKKLGEDAFKE